MKNFWKNKKVLVTGGAGFVGSFVCEHLLKKGAKITITTNSGNTKNIKSIKKDIKIINCDLTNPEKTNLALKNQEIVLALAANVAGIQFNINHPATMFTKNVQIVQNTASAALKNGVERLLIVSSACVYPRNCSVPTPEVEGFLEDPEPTNLGYGWSKRVSELIGRFYNQEYGLKIAIARPYNAYGPRDNFDPRYSHVIPGLIKRVLEGENPLIVWGSGKQTRSFLYVEDLASALILQIEKYPVTDPVNIGTEEEVTISNLAQQIVNISKKDIRIKFDTTKPDGQPRRNCDTKKLKSKVGFTAPTTLENGLKSTILWYKKQL